MDLPTYTNIWRIEKRLYKLYDFNLPTPLPIVQIGVFVGVFVSWIVFLQLVRLPFQPPWHVVYLVPPGVVAYLATRPVLEGKRLTELLLAQLRYVTEPRLWCRLVPAHEAERTAVVGTVWRLTTPLSAVTPARGSPAPSPDGRPGQGPGQGAGHAPPGRRRLTRATGAPLAERRRRPARQTAGEMRNQAQMPVWGARRVVVLGCAGGAGQTTTALMLGHVLARCRPDRCVAVDLAPGRGSLAQLTRTESPETMASLLAGIGNISGYLGLRAYAAQSGSGLEVLASGDSVPQDSIGEGDLATAAGVLDRFYTVSLFDPAPAVAPRVLPLADQLVLVVPAGGDAAKDAAAASEWLDRHGYRRLATGAVLVVNGVTKETAADAARVEAGAAWCRAVVRIPLDGHLHPKDRVPASLEVPETLPAAVRAGYLRLGSAVAAGFPALPDRYRQRPGDRRSGTEEPGYKEPGDREPRHRESGYRESAR